MSAVPTFAEFFTAARGVAPFPWQVRLADIVVASGWPALLDLPTGAGKTTALDIALWSLAVAPTRLPRRTILVVDRRVVVDQGADAARALLDAMRRASDGPVRAVTDALRATFRASDAEDPFAIAVLRGGMPRDNDWARRPDQPVLGVSTVDQVGSRLLFRGYGIADRSLSLHAGLIGEDTLILLDEVHLSVPFAETLGAIRSRLRRADVPTVDRFQVAMLSATPGHEAGGPRFTLDQTDRANPVLSARLGARKAARLVPIKVAGPDEPTRRASHAESIAERALALLGSDVRTLGVVVNRVALAQDVAKALRAKALPDVTAVLLTGRMRPLERDRIVQDVLMPRVGPRSARAPHDGRTIVVATQCIEAGADLDFDALVTECASIDALRQRFGRLDRAGARGASVAEIVIRHDLAAEDDPVYGSALAATWRALQAHATNGIVPFGIDECPRTLLDDPELRARVPSAPVLMPAHVAALAQTAPVADFAPDIAPYLHGPDERPADVQLVWRADLVLPADMRAEVADTVARLDALPPSTLEAVSVPVWAARTLLDRDGAGDVADVPMRQPEAPRARRETGEAVAALRWRGDDSTWVRARDVRPGDVLVVPSSIGGLHDGHFDPTSAVPVPDVAEAAHWRSRRVAALRLDRPVLAWTGVAASMPATDVDDYDTPKEFCDTLRDWLATLPDDCPAAFPLAPSEYREWRRSLGDGRARVLSAPMPMLVARAQRISREVAPAATEEDRGNAAADGVTIASHVERVAALAREFAESLALPAPLVDDVARAALLHDAGKADPRFQAMLLGGDEDAAALLEAPLAKSSRGFPARPTTARVYPAGARHEMLSLRLAEHSRLLAEAHDHELVRHLIASHHGWARPFAPALADGDERVAVVTLQGETLEAPVAHGYGVLGDGLPERFEALQRRYGTWGLAWFEALLRLADHRASEEVAG